MDLDALRQIESLASSSHSQLVQASRRLVWRRYAPAELILPHHQVHTRLNGLVYRGKVQIATVQGGHRQVVGHILAKEPIPGELEAHYSSPVELRAVEPTILCLLPSDTPQSTNFLGRISLLFQFSTSTDLSRIPATIQKQLDTFVHILQAKSAEILEARPLNINRTTVGVLLFSIILLALATWCWQSPLKTLRSRFAYALAAHQLEESYYAKALSLLQTSVDLNPRLAMAHNDIGYIYYQWGWAKQAQVAFQQAVAADPTSAVAQNNLGLSYLEDGQLDLAREALGQAVTLNPESAEAWTNLGVVEHSSGQPEKAIRAYRTALHLDPQDTVAQVNLGILYYEQEQFSEAQDYLKMALDARPNLARAKAILGTIALSEGEYVRAWGELYAVAPALADDPLFHFYLALLYEDAGAWARAERELVDVLELQPHPDLAALARSHLAALVYTGKLLSSEEINIKGGE